jgi:hypothetical protein
LLEGLPIQVLDLEGGRRVWEGVMKGNAGRRDPFGLGLRQKAVPGVETPKRRGLRDNNGEKMAPDGNVANVSITSSQIFSSQIYSQTKQKVDCRTLLEQVRFWL